MIPFIDLNRGIAHDWGRLLNEQRRAVEDMVFLGGPHVEAFEKQFAATLGSEYFGAAVGCGTDALAIALMCVGVGVDSQVMVPAFGCPSTADAVRQIGASVVLVECDARSGLSEAAHFMAAREENPGVTHAIAVHLFGKLVDVPAIIEAVGSTDLEIGVEVIEDCAQAHGVSGAGQHGAMAAWSFYPTKNLGAWGDAGMVTASSSLMVEFAKGAREYRARAHTMPEDGSLGLCSRMDVQQALVLAYKLRRLFWRHDRQRREIVQMYSENLPESVMPWRNAGDVPVRDWNGHIFPIVVDNRDEFRDEMLSRGVQTGVHYALELDPSQWPNAARWGMSEVSLPIFPGMRRSEVLYVCNAVSESLKVVA